MKSDEHFEIIRKIWHFSTYILRDHNKQHTYTSRIPHSVRNTAHTASQHNSQSLQSFEVCYHCIYISMVLFIFFLSFLLPVFPSFAFPLAWLLISWCFCFPPLNNIWFLFACLFIYSNFGLPSLRMSRSTCEWKRFVKAIENVRKRMNRRAKARSKKKP